MHKRFIEYDLPLAEISAQSAREKNIRHGHPSTLHIWWARRPLASSRYSDDPSTGSGQALLDTCYIEVKARARSGAIRLSANEWKQARKFGDQYWLYVVTQARTDAPQMQRIRDPAERFQVGTDIFATGFIILEERWRDALRELEKARNKRGKTRKNSE
jgi:hypothetical protein